MKIGELARSTGASTATIRYYEAIGLIPPSARNQGDQRRYSNKDVERLAFIRRCRALGFSLQQIRSLSNVAKSGASSAACMQIMQARLATVRRDLDRLHAAERRLVELLAASAPASENCAALSALA